MRKRRKALTQTERDLIAKLATMSDDKIDTADIPEAAPENWMHVRRA